MSDIQKQQSAVSAAAAAGQEGKNAAGLLPYDRECVCECVLLRAHEG